jgi:hypothetical protein
MRPRPARLGRCLVGQPLQQALEADTWQAEPEPLVRPWPKPRNHEGQGTVMGRTVHGLAVPVRLPSARRQGQRRAGHRAAGGSAGLVLCGLDDRCPPALAAAVRVFAAMVGAVAEAQDVWAARGVEVETTTVRLLASRDAARARLAPQIARTAFADTGAARRAQPRGGTPAAASAHKGTAAQAGAAAVPGRMACPPGVDRGGSRCRGAASGPRGPLHGRHAHRARGGSRPAPPLLAAPGEHPSGSRPLERRGSARAMETGAPVGTSVRRRDRTGA